MDLLHSLQLTLAEELISVSGLILRSEEHTSELQSH